MIDWGLVLENSTWLAGLSLIMAVVSLASYRAGRQGMTGHSFRVSVASSGWVSAGGTLVCAGLSLTTGSLLEAILWALLGVAIAIAWAARAGARAGTEVRAAGAEPQLPISSGSLAGHYSTLATWIVRLELLWLVLLSPFYLFPGNGGPGILAVAALPLIWVARRIAHGRFVPATPLDWPIFLMLVMVLVSLFVTFDPALSLGKVTGLLFGVAIYYAIVGLVSDAGKPIRWVLIGYSAAGLLLALVGLLGTAWSSKFNFMAGLEARLPTFLRGLPGAENGINPNETAGALLWIVPVQLALLRATWSPRFRDTRFGGALVAGAIVMAAISGGVLLLAESRGALAGLALGLLVLLAALLPRTRAVPVAAGVLAAVAVAVALYLGPANIANEVLGSVGTGFGTGDLVTSVESRTEIWSRALYGIQDFPLTGMGMNSFRSLMPALYPTSFPPGTDQAHAHNNMLQVALDLGLPGLVAYIALWLVSALLVVEVWRQSTTDWIRWMAGGIAAGLAAYTLFGLADTVSLGAKPGIFFWGLLALLVVAWQQVQAANIPPIANESAHAPSTRQISMKLQPSRNNSWPEPRVRAAGALLIGVLLLGALVLRMGDIVRAIQRDAFSVEMARAIAGPAGGVPVAADASLDLPETERLSGMLALKNGDTAAADAYFEKAIEGSAGIVPLVRNALPQDETLARLAYTLYPSIPDSPAWLADALAKNQPEEALKLYKEAVGLDPLDNMTWERMGLLAQSLGQNDVALDALGKACDLNPRRTGPCIIAARLSYAAGTWDRVIYYFVRGSMPGNYRDWVLLIKAAQKLGRTADANAYLAQAQKAIPADYKTLLAKQP